VTLNIGKYFRKDDRSVSAGKNPRNCVHKKRAKQVSETRENSQSAPATSSRAVRRPFMFRFLQKLLGTNSNVLIAASTSAGHGRQKSGHYNKNKYALAPKLGAGPDGVAYGPSFEQQALRRPDSVHFAPEKNSLAGKKYLTLNS
jgi:hypothetical protein